ncbi:MAG: hypothetical protein R2716_04210 [Microthrixaceae bacterium]
MPNVLSKLGAEVLAVNPFVSTAGMLGYDRSSHAAQVAALVTASGADLGGDRPQRRPADLVDGDGAVLSDTEALFAFLELLDGVGTAGGATVALPVNAPRAAEQIVRAHGLELRWTKTSAPSLMADAEEPGVAFAMNLEGGVILPEFMPAFDAAAGLLKLLDLLTIREMSLSDVRAGLPTARREGVGGDPLGGQGVVMRTLVEQTQGRDVELIDGVKVNHDHGWVLVLPDPEEPTTHIWAEGDSAAEAKALTQEYARRLRQMMR